MPSENQLSSYGWSDLDEQMEQLLHYQNDVAEEEGDDLIGIINN